MTSCSTVLLAEKSILQILLLEHQDLHKRLRKNILRPNGGFHSKSKMKTY